MSEHMPRVSSSIYWIYKKEFHSKKSYKKLDVEENAKCSRPNVLNSKYFNPTSLPLCFYFGYQIVEVCGPVSYSNSLFVGFTKTTLLEISTPKSKLTVC